MVRKSEGQEGQRPLRGLNLGDASRHLGGPKESVVPPSRWTLLRHNGQIETPRKMV